MPILNDISVLYQCGPNGSEIRDAAIVWQNERIQWVGSQSLLPIEFQQQTTISARGGIAIPGLIDSHTHLGFGGWRPLDYLGRLHGDAYAASHQETASNEKIAGQLVPDQPQKGITATLNATRALSPGELTTRCLSFLQKMTDLGVSTVECKSGYGLSVDSELKILQAYKQIAQLSPLTIVPTFMGAHFIPPEFTARREYYVRMLIDELIPRVAEEKLARFCDIFCESIAFSHEETKAIASSAAAHGLGIKLHVDQLANSGGAILAAELGAISADHLEYTDEHGAKALASGNTVATILPLASLYLKDRFADGRMLKTQGCSIAIATDFNPGSAPSFHLPLAMALACLNCGLTPHEALEAATYNAARALDLEKERGSLEVGKYADIVIIDARDVVHWMYHFQANACTLNIKNGITLKTP